MSNGSNPGPATKDEFKVDTVARYTTSNPVLLGLQKDLPNCRLRGNASLP